MQYEAVSAAKADGAKPFGKASLGFFLIHIKSRMQYDGRISASSAQPYSSSAPEPGFARFPCQDSNPLSCFDYSCLARKSSKMFCMESFGSNFGR